MESIEKFCETMNALFDVISHPISSFQHISFGVCLLGAGLAILWGIAGFEKYYKVAVGFFLFYVVINYLF